MKITVEKSGGFAGIPSTNEIDADELPSSLEGTVRQLLHPKKLTVKQSLKQAKGAADYFNYKIIIQDGNKDRIIECNEIHMDSSLKSLISYIQKNARKK
jgi:hypothetical protein